MDAWNPLEMISYSVALYCEWCEAAIGTYNLRDDKEQQERSQTNLKQNHAERCQIQILREIRDLLRQQP